LCTLSAAEEAMDTAWTFRLRNERQSENVQRGLLGRQKANEGPFLGVLLAILPLIAPAK
jgi:hypothetical protein